MKRTRSYNRLIGLPVLAVTVAMLSLSLDVSPASARRARRFTRVSTAGLLTRVTADTGGTCLQDEYAAAGNTQTLSCSANDVRVAAVTNIRKLDGTPLETCNAGETFNFIADFTIVTSSKSSRSNIGLYFATRNQPTALTGSCSDNIIPAESYTCPGSTSVTCGSDNDDEFDASPDNCGDTSSSDDSPTAGIGAQVVTIEVHNFLCQAPSGTTELVLPNCTSWQVPGKTTLCEAAGSYYDYPFDPNGAAEAIPGSPSKCNCGTIPLGITVQSPAMSVTKQCSVDDGKTYDSSSCSMDDPGGAVTYKIDVQNSSNFGPITLDQICDDRYENIAQTSGFSTNCGTTTTSTGTTCSLPQTIAAGSDYSCTFTAKQGEGLPVSDIATTYSVGQDGTNPFSKQSNSVTVTVNEAPSTAHTTTGYIATNSGCVTVRYKANVKNTSSADEDLTLSGLTDDSTDITKLGTKVLGTTCGVAKGSYGLGTMANGQPGALVSGAGTLPATLAVAGSDYVCYFDAQFCGAIGPVNDGACSGIQNTGTVTATLTGDEGETVTQNESGLTVYECISASSSPN